MDLYWPFIFVQVLTKPNVGLSGLFRKKMFLERIMYNIVSFSFSAFRQTNVWIALWAKLFAPFRFITIYHR